VEEVAAYFSGVFGIQSDSKVKTLLSEFFLCDSLPQRRESFADHKAALREKKVRRSQSFETKLISDDTIKKSLQKISSSDLDLTSIDMDD